MSGTDRLRSVLALISVFAMVAVGSALVTVGDPTSGPIEVYEDTAVFEAATGATAIDWVSDASSALPEHPWSFIDYSCAGFDQDWSLTTPGGEATVTNPGENYICYIGKDWNAPAGNTSPQPEGPTIVDNGEDDYQVVITFAEPTHAVGLGLLTNSAASEAVTLTFDDGDTYTIGDATLGTAANSFEFVGFRSQKPIVEVALNTTGGRVQNEGITGIWIGASSAPATMSCPAGQYFVDSYGSGIATPVVGVPAVSGYPYRLTASGVYYAGGTSLYDIAADADYSQDQYQRINGEPWTDLVRNYESYGASLLALKVDDAHLGWGAYSADHTYSMEYVATGSTIDLQIYDVYANNNMGGLCVEVEPLALRSVNGGGQIIAESMDAKDKHPYKVSFGGHIDDIDGALVCEWQVNLHNVSGKDLDKSKYHTTTCTEFNTWAPGEQYQSPTTWDPALADGVANFTTWGTFNGEPGYKAIFRVEDRTEPSNLDTFRITIYDDSNSVVYDTDIGDFPRESNNVGTHRTLLDRGNIQIRFYE